MLKARVSYGLTGNNGIGLYDTYGSYNSLYTYNGNATTTTNTMPNNGLIWEKTLQFNAGIDLGLLDNRITLALDYYNKETRDLLFDVSLPNTTGYNSVSDQPGARQVLRHGAVSVVGQHRPQGFFVEDGFYVQLQHEPRARTARQRQSPQPHQRHLGR